VCVSFREEASERTFPAEILAPRSPNIQAKTGEISLDCLGQESDDSRGMRIFTIDAGNTIAVSTSTERGLKSRGERFTNEKQLAALAEHWPGGRLVEIWNNLPGIRKIAKFTNRQTVYAGFGGPSSDWSPALAHTRPQAAIKRAAGAKWPVHPSNRSWRARIPRRRA